MTCQPQWIFGWHFRRERVECTLITSIFSELGPAGHFSGRLTTFFRRQEAAFWSLMMVLAVLIQIPLSVGAPGSCRVMNPWT